MSLDERQFEKQWQNKFSETAKKDKEDYQISIRSKLGLEAHLKYFFQYFAPYIQKDNSKTLLLDLGCGPGTFSKLLAQKGFQVIGVDYSKEVIEVAKQRSKNEKIDFQIADIYNLPFENNFFDIVICLEVFQTIAKPLEAIQEIKRVLKKGGLVVITSLNCFSLFSLFSLFKKRNTPPVKRYNPYQLRAILKKENFNEIRLRGICVLPFSFLTNFIIKFKVYKLFNLFFPFFIFLFHSFYIKGRKSYA